MCRLNKRSAYYKARTTTQTQNQTVQIHKNKIISPQNKNNIEVKKAIQKKVLGQKSKTLKKKRYNFM